MKAILLAGGKGTRLRPLTHTMNKHLMPLANKAVLFYALENLVNAGITEIFVNINKGDESVKDYLKRYYPELKLHFIEQASANGMMYPITIAEKFIGDDDFVLYAGDNLLLDNLKTYIEKFNKLDCDAMVLVKNVKKLEKFSYYKLKGNKVVSIEEKPAKLISNFAGTAIYFYRGKAIFKALKNVKPVQLSGTKTAEFYPPLVHQWLIDNGYTLKISEVSGYWCDIGERGKLLKANAEILKRMKLLPSNGNIHKTRVKGKFHCGTNCEVNGCKIIGPVNIGNNVKINNSVIGPFVSIADNCVLDKVKVKNSIVLENTSLANISREVEDSIIGSDVTVGGLKSKDKLQLMVAAHSQIKV